VTAIGVGDDFVIALGQTIPFTELEYKLKKTKIPKFRSASNQKYKIKRLSSKSPSRSELPEKQQSLTTSQANILSQKLMVDPTLTLKSNKTIASNSDIQSSQNYVKAVS